MRLYLTTVLALLAAPALLACEGEPPKVPVSFTPAPATDLPQPGEENQPVVVEKVIIQKAPAAPAAAAPCAPAAPATAAEADGGVGVAAAAPAPPAAALPTHLNIMGKVTSQPAPLARNAVVYLVDAPIEADDKHKKLTITNSMMNFSPFIGVVTTGGKVTFYNGDPFPHNVFSPDNEKFDMGNIGAKSGNVRTFAKSGGYTLLCNLHPGMLGYVFSSPSSYFSKVDAQGNFTISNVPVGTYKIAVWAPRATPTEQSVTLTNADANVSLEIKRK